MTIPLTVVIEGRSHEVLNWSLGGFRTAGFGDGMRPRDELVGHLVLSYQAFALQHLLGAAMEGRLDNVESVLGFVDAPVATGKLEELLEEENETHVQVGCRRLTRKSTLYLGTGAPAWMRRFVPAYQTVVSGAVFLTLVALGVGVMKIPSGPPALMAEELATETV